MKHFADRRIYAMAGSKAIMRCKYRGNNSESSDNEELGKNVTWSLANNQSVKSIFTENECFNKKIIHFV